jgi:response regulator RpfG family c-di-GMP phosphodiesterase
VVLANKLLLKDGSFSRKCGASLIMDRKSISLSRLLYVIRVLRKRTFRTVLSRDLRAGLELPAELYHFLPANNRYSVFLPAGDAISPSKLEKLSSTHADHLYVQEEHFPKLIASIRTATGGDALSEDLAHVRMQFVSLIRAIFDISTDGNISMGKKLMEDGQEIVARLVKMISEYPDERACLRELPYPRWSAIAHGINCAVFALLFAKRCQLSDPQELAWAALLHNIGLADVDQALLAASEFSLSQEEKRAYLQHVDRSLDILKTKQIPVSPRIESAIRFHHENYDGTGYPEARAGTTLPVEAALLAIVGAFDHIYALRPGAKALTPAEAWQELLRLQGSGSELGKKFHPALLEKIGAIFS